MIKEEYNSKIAEMLSALRNRGIKGILAFSGSVPRELEERAKTIVEESFEVLKNYPLAIQTGGTKFDIQNYAAEASKRFGMPLIGVYPSRGLKYRLDNLDFAIEVSPRYGTSEWGDDTEIFAKLPQAVEIIGGSVGTLIEFGHLIKVNDSKFKEKRDLIYIAPVVFDGIITTADIGYIFPLKPEQKEAFPKEKIVENGRKAAEFLVNKLGVQ